MIILYQISKFNFNFRLQTFLEWKTFYKLKRFFVANHQQQSLKIYAQFFFEKGCSNATTILCEYDTGLQECYLVSMQDSRLRSCIHSKKNFSETEIVKLDKLKEVFIKYL